MSPGRSTGPPRGGAGLRHGNSHLLPAEVRRAARAGPVVDSGLVTGVLGGGAALSLGPGAEVPRPWTTPSSWPRTST